MTDEDIEEYRQQIPAILDNATAEWNPRGPHWNPITGDMTVGEFVKDVYDEGPLMGMDRWTSVMTLVLMHLFWIGVLGFWGLAVVLFGLDFVTSSTGFTLLWWTIPLAIIVAVISFVETFKREEEK